MKTDSSNPLAVTLPYQFNGPDDYPTEVLASRFQAWRYIIKDIVNYLREYSSVQEEIVRQQIRLQQAVGISAKSIAVTSNSSRNHHHSGKDVDVGEINKYFLPIGNGSIQDLPTILTKYHQQNVSATQKTLKELTTVVIPKLDELRKDLLIKIKEIKNLQNDFKNNLGKEINETKSLLNQYYQAVELSNKLEHGGHIHHLSDSNEQYKFDPYIVKVKLDRQLKKQLQEESYLYQAYENLQDSGRKLESIIVVELQNYLGNFMDLLSAEHSTFANFLLPNFNDGFLSKEASFEWDSFIAKNLPSPNYSLNAVGNSNSSVRNGTFIDLNFHQRKTSDLQISNYNSPLNLSVREGYLERRSKFLKNYSSGYYVLTCNFIHEFKSPDRKKDQVPILSILLDSCQVGEHSKNDNKLGSSYKFILNSKLSNGLMHRNQNWLFRAETYQSMIEWYNDIKNLTSLPTPSARARFLSKKLNLGNLNPNLVRMQSNMSRNSSIVTSQTNQKSIRSSVTGRSKKSTTTDNNRLSSTFSNNTNVHSPRFNHLINSDGTILTPVESSTEHVRSSTPNAINREQPPQPHQQQYQQQYPIQQTPQEGYQPQVGSVPQKGEGQDGLSRTQSVQYQIPATNIQQPTPQQPHQPNQPHPGPITLPANFHNFQQGYFINANGQQVQQFFDPIQQQYYTITQQPSQGPQPQYFPTSPQPQFPSSPQPNQGYFFVQPPPNQNPQLKGDYTFGGQLPYPTDEQPELKQPELKQPESKQPQAEPNHEINDKENETSKNGSNDENNVVSTDDTLKDTTELEREVSKVSI